MNTPYQLEVIARQHQSEILARAEADRLVRQARRANRSRPRRPLGDYLALALATAVSAATALRGLTSAASLDARRTAVARFGVVQ